MKTLPLRPAFLGLAFTLLSLLGSGCSTPNIDWAGRVGSYTYDQAVMDFGPPDKQAMLSNGSTVAEWLTRRGRNHLYASPAYYPYWGVPYHPTYLDTYSPDRFLRLTFDTDGTLKAWKRFSR